MKRWISMFLALVMLISCLPVQAFAAESETILTEETVLAETVSEESEIPVETEVTENTQEEPEATEETEAPETAPVETEASDAAEVPETIPEETELPEETEPSETLPEETEPQQTVPQETVPETTVPELTEEETVPGLLFAEGNLEIPFQVNPLYEGLVDTQALESKLDSLPMRPAARAVEGYASEAEAAELIRIRMKNRTEAFTISVYSEQTNVKTMINSIIAQACAHTGNPLEGDYLRWQYGGWRASYSSAYDDYGNYYYTIDMQIPYYTTYSQEVEMDIAVDDLLNSLSLDGKTDYEKIKLLYDYITANVTYDYANLNNDAYDLKYSAYAALINGTAICQGYANLLYRLALEVGVDCRFIGGTGNGDPHGWNIIKLGDRYYNADSTWDEGRTTYRYFLRCTANFGDHQRDAEYETAAFHAAYPMSTTDYNPSGTVEPSTLQVHTSATEVDLVMGQTESATIYVWETGTYPDYNYYFSCGRNNANVSCTWGEWGEDGKLPLYITANNAGTTTIRISVNDATTEAVIDYVDVQVTIAAGQEYTISYNANGGSGAPSSQTKTYGTALTLSGDIPVRNGYIFLGWSKSASATTATYLPGGTYTDNSSTTLYAVWKAAEVISSGVNDSTYNASIAFPNAYMLYSFTPSAASKVRFESSGSKDSQIYVYDANGNQLAFDDDSGDGTNFLLTYDFTAGTKYYIKIRLYSSNTGTTTFTAKRVYSIAYDANGGSGAPDSQDKIHGEDLTLSSTVPTNSSKEFLGWATGASATTAQYQPGATYSANANAILYAVWKSGEEPHVHSFDSNHYCTCGIYGGTCGDPETLTWTLSDGVLTISGEGSMAFYDAEEDAPWWNIRNQITSIIMEEGLDYIGGNNFCSLGSVTSIYIPASVTYISDSGILDCPSLQQIIVAEDSFAFTSQDGVLFDKNMTWLEKYPAAKAGTSYVIPDTVTNIELYAFEGAANLKNVTMPDGLTYIGACAFQGAGLTGITIPTNVETIGRYAFSGCTSLTQVDLPQSITVISYASFADCTALQQIEIPESVQTIGDCAFLNTGLTEIVIPDQVTELGIGSFAECTQLQQAEFGDNLEVISARAFEHCTGLQQITIPDSVTDIKGYSFTYCTGLTSITLPIDRSFIYPMAFRGCHNLTEVVLPETVEALGDNAFSAFEYVSVIRFDGKAPTFAENAFCGITATAYHPYDATWTASVMQNYGGNITWASSETTHVHSFNGENYCTCGVYGGTCGDNATWLLEQNGVLTISGTGKVGYFDVYAVSDIFKTLVISEGITEIDSFEFSNCKNLTSITVPKSLAKIGTSAFSGCSGIVDVYIADLEAWLKLDAEDSFAHPMGCYSNEKKLYLNGTLITNLVIPEEITEIPGYAFHGASSILSVSLPDDLTKIGSYAFAGCSGLTEMMLPESITEIGSGAFDYCSNLTSITLPDGISVVNCFMGCTKLTSVTLPDSVSEIGYSAFEGCTSLSSITLPAGLTQLKFYAFKDCTALKTITFTGDAPTIHDDVFGGVTAVAYYPSDNSTWTPAVLQNYGGSITWAPIGQPHVHSFDSNHYCTCGIYGGVCGDSLTWILDNGVLTVSGSGEMWDFSEDEPAQWWDVRDQIISIVVEEGVDNIGIEAFSSMAGVTSISIPESVVYISTYGIYECSALQQILVDDNNIAYTSRNGILFKKNMTWLEKYPAAKTETSYVIPDTVTNIEFYAFDGAAALESITIPESVTYIGAAAFRNTGLTGITIPGEVTSIGRRAFYGCADLQEITFTGDVPSIGENSFETVTATVYYPGDNSTWTAAVRQNYGGTITWVPVGGAPVEALEITSQPENFEGSMNSYAYFTVAVNKEDVTYQWYYSGDNGETWVKSGSTGNQTNTLTVQIKDYRLSQLYRCEITDSEGNVVVSNAVAMLLPPSTIEIVHQPADVYGAPAEQMTISLEATGENLKYQWYYSADGGETWSLSWSSGYNTNTLSPVLRAYNSGRLFKCLITDKNGNTEWSEVAKMELASSEIIIHSQPESYTGKANDLTTFTVVAEGTNLEYRWYYSDDGGETWQASFNTGYNTASMQVRLYAYRSGYQYKCVLSSGGQVKAETVPAVLSLYPQTAKIVSHPMNAGAEVYKYVTFHVEATGENLQYQWQYSSDGGNTWTNSSGTGSTTDTIEVMVIKGRDGYKYRCQITDESGVPVNSQPATLRVGSMPAITSQPKSHTGTVGSTAVFTVVATGQGLQYQWQYSNNGGVSWTNSSMTGNKTESLTVVVTNARNGQQYRCVITNEFGSVISDAATLVVK